MERSYKCFSPYWLGAIKMFYGAVLLRVNNQSVTVILVLKVCCFFFLNQKIVFYFQDGHGQTLNNDSNLWRELLIVFVFMVLHMLCYNYSIISAHLTTNRFGFIV